MTDFDTASTPRTYLCFDYGQRRIGVAVGTTLTRTARPLPTVANLNRPDWPSIDKLVGEWRPAAMIVGLPLDEQGHDQAITGPARRFAARLQQRFGLPAHLADERYSSRAADDELRQARASGRKTRRLRKGDRDAEAARVILEQWLSEFAGSVPHAHAG